MTAYIHNGSTWRTIEDLYVHDGSTNRRIEQGWVHDGANWREFYAYDLAGPAVAVAPTANWLWDNGVAKNVVAWGNPNDADFAYTKLYVNRASSIVGPWSFVGDFPGSPGQTMSWVDTAITFAPYTPDHPNNLASVAHYYKMVTYDTRGNEGASIVVGSSGYVANGTIRGMLSNPYYVRPTWSRTWRSGVWSIEDLLDAQNSDGEPTMVMQGYSSTAGANLGFWFYELARPGLVPTTLDMWIHRTGGIGFSAARAPRLWLSPVNGTMTQNNTDPRPLAHIDGPYAATPLAVDTGAWCPILSSWGRSLMNPYVYEATKYSSIMARTDELAVLPGYSFSDSYSRYFAFSEGGVTRSGTLRFWHDG